MDRFRNSKIFILNDAIKTLRNFMFFIIILLIDKKLTGLLIAFGIMILIAIKSFISWRNYYFTILEDKFIIEKGIIVKKKTEIYYDKIHTMDVKENLLSRLFNVVELKIDNGSTELGKAEIYVTLKKDKINNFINTVENKKSSSSITEKENTPINNNEGIEKEEILHNYKIRKITPKELMLNALLRPNLGTLLVVITFVSNISDFVNIFDSNIVSKFEELFNNYLGQVQLWFSILMLTLTVLIFNSLIGIVVSLIKYSSFTLSANEKNIKISYGFFTLKEYTIPIKKIKAITLKQSFLQKLFGYYMIEVKNMGYGDEKKEVAILFPICDKAFIEETLFKLLPSFKFNESELVTKEGIAYNRASRKFNLFIFSIILILFLSINWIFEVFSFKFSLVIATAILPIGLILNFIKFMVQKRYKLIINKINLVYYKNLISKSILIVPIKSIEYINLRQGPIKKRYKHYSLYFDLGVNLLSGSLIPIENIEESIAIKITSNLYK